MPDLPPWVQRVEGGVALRIHARPGAKQSDVSGAHGDALAVRIAARPVEGAANRELVAVLARALDVAPSRIVIDRGQQGKAKRVRVEGLDADEVVRRLTR